jgi:hypothetical protein
MSIPYNTVMQLYYGKIILTLLQQLNLRNFIAINVVGFIALVIIDLQWYNLTV